MLPTPPDDAARPDIARRMYTTQLATGLIVATDGPWRPREDAEATIAMGTMLAAPTAKDLELGADTLDDAIALISGIPFGPAMFMASAIAAQLHHHTRDIEWQLDLARQMLPPAVVRRIEEFVRDDPEGHIVFDARFVHALQRVLIVHAAPDTTPRDLDEGEIAQVAGALFALAADLPAVVPPDQDLAVRTGAGGLTSSPSRRAGTATPTSSTLSAARMRCSRRFQRPPSCRSIQPGRRSTSV